MRLAGLKNCFVVSNREEAEEIVKNIQKKELIVANTGVVEMLPELLEMDNLVTLPDDPKQFGSVDDLKSIVKSAIGFEPKLE